MATDRSSASDPARAARLAGWGLVVVAAVAAIGFPLFDLGRELVAAGGGAVGEVLGGDRTWGPIAATLWTSALVTALTLVGATAAALAVAGISGRRRALVIGAMVLPLLIPPFVSALSWMAAFGPGGLLDDLVGLAMPGLVGPVGVVLVLVVSAMPIAFLVVAAAVDVRSERDLVRAARVAGASPGEAFRTVTLPLLRLALVAAGAITFIMSANAFGVPAVLGSPAGFGTATTRLYRDLVFSADPAAFDRVLVLAAFLALVTLAVVAIADRSGSGPVRMRVEASGPRLAVRRMTRRAAVGITLWVVMTTAIPLLALVLTALTRSVGLTPVPGNLTLEHFGEALDSGAASAFGKSLLLGLAAATIVVVLGGVLVALERRRRSGAGTVVALAFAVPGSVVAVAVLLAWGPWLRDTVLIILIAYVAKFWALGHRPIAGSADAVSPELFGAARVAGAARSTAARTITLPLLAPAVATGWLVVFVFALHELTMSSLLYGPGSETLAVAVLDLQQLGDPTVTAALAVMLTAAAVVASLPLVWLLRTRRVRPS
jgi:iron(III) transport system permease protein